MGVVARIAALAAVAAALFAPAAHAGTGTGALRICSSCAQNAGDLSRYDYAILNAWDAYRIPALKAANPALKLLVYKNASMTVDYSVSGGVDNPFLTTGVGYAAASATHPEWFLRDTAGQRVESSGYAGAWLMDLGSRAYQDAWLQNVAAEVRAQGWDGVMVDDVNVTPRWHTGVRTLAAYPTDASYTAATRSFLARVGPALRAQGALFVPNIYTEWPTGPVVWRDWLQFTSGAVQEYWTKWGQASGDHFTGADWSYRQQFLGITQAAGKLYLGVTYAPKSDVRSMTYARASFLLDWNGGSSALVFEAPDGQDPYASEWTAQIGRPAGAKVVAGGAWRRGYSGGTVLVNPSGAPVTVTLGRPHLQADGTRVSSVTLAPATGLVLRYAPSRR
jgi:hypothetical protein